MTQRFDINRAAGRALIGLSLFALVWVAVAVALASSSAQPSPPRNDEGPGARGYQLLLLVMVLIGFTYVATANWTRPLRSLLPLALPVIATAASFVILLIAER